MANGLPFAVVWARPALNTVGILLAQLRATGRVEELLRLVRIINQRLTDQPLDFGEVYRTRGAVHEQLAICDSLSVDFAVDTERQVVLVRHCQAMSGFGR